MSLPSASKPGLGLPKGKGKGRAHTAQTALAAKHATQQSLTSLGEEGRRRVEANRSESGELTCVGNHLSAVLSTVPADRTALHDGCFVCTESSQLVVCLEFLAVEEMISGLLVLRLVYAASARRLSLSARRVPGVCILALDSEPRHDFKGFSLGHSG